MAEQIEDQGSEEPSRYGVRGTGLSGVSTQKFITDPRTGLTVVCDPESGVSGADTVRQDGSKRFAASRLFDVHLIFNSQDQAEFVNWIDEELRQRGIRSWLWNRDAQVFDKDEIESIRSTPVSAIFLSQRGWGPYHRKFAQLACDEKRPVIPIILGSCREQDREAVGNVFQVSKWIIFSSQKDTRALNELAQRIVNLPYVHETERHQATGDGAEAVKSDPSLGRRLVVYVPARSQTIASWDSLRKPGCATRKSTSADKRGFDSSSVRSRQRVKISTNEVGPMFLADLSALLAKEERRLCLGSLTPHAFRRLEPPCDTRSVNM